MKKIFNIYTSTAFGALLVILAEYIKSESINVIGFTLFLCGVLILMFIKIIDFIHRKLDE